MKTTVTFVDAGLLGCNPCRVVGDHQRFKGTCCLYLQGATTQNTVTFHRRENLTYHTNYFYLCWFSWM
jgi:hypothetical protein